MVRFDGYRRASPLPSPKQQWQLLLWVLIVGMLMIAPQWFFGLRGGWHAPERPTQGNFLEKSTALPQNAKMGMLSEYGVQKSQSTQLALPQLLSAVDFSQVKDDAPFRNFEKDAWFETLKILRETPLSELWETPAERVTFAQLYRRPRDYRGQLVEIRGRIMEVYPLSAPPNDVGIQSYYQLWFCPEEENDPVVVYCLELPHRFPMKERLSEPAVIRGVFFKRWAYQAKDGLRFAPVVLASSFHWTPAVPTPQTPEQSAPDPLLAVFAALVLTAIFLWYALRIRERQYRGKRAKFRSARSTADPTATTESEGLLGSQELHSSASAGE